MQFATSLRKYPKIVLLVAALGALSAWFFVNHVLIPHQIVEAAAVSRPRGNLSDLYPRWLGARELLLHGRDPYSAEVTREIQTGYYGRPLDPRNPGDPKDQQGFAYPLYVVFVLAPTVALRFEVVQVFFRWFLVGLLAASFLWWVRALGVRLSTTSKLIWIVLTLGSFPAIQGIKLQQLTLLVCGLLAAAMAALAKGRPATAGILLAVATIKPQLSGILVAWLALWVLGDWHSRKRLAWGFVGTMSILIGAAELLLPGWTSRFRIAASAYWEYTGGGNSWLDVALSPAAGKPLAGVALLLLAVFCWSTRRYPANAAQFGKTLSLVLATTLVVIPSYALYNQLLLLPPLLLIVGSAPQLWRAKRLPRLLLIATGIAVLWPWFAASWLDLSLLVVSQRTVQKAWSAPLWTTLAIPFMVLASTLISLRMVPEELGSQRATVR